MECSALMTWWRRRFEAARDVYRWLSAARSAAPDPAAAIAEWDKHLSAIQDQDRRISVGLDALEQQVADLNVAMEQLGTRISSDLADVTNAQVRFQSGMRREWNQLQRILQTRKIRIDFLFQLPEVWSSWETIWEHCLTDERIKARLILLPFFHGSSPDVGRARRFLGRKGYSFTDLSAYDLGRDQPDIVFVQNPYDSTRPEELNTSALLERGIKIVYVPYGLDVCGGEENIRWQYDLDIQRKAWRIFVRSEAHRRMYAEHCQAGNEHVIVSGHPKMDKMVAQGKQKPDAEAAAERDGRVVLWCPHFSVGGKGWSTYDRLAEPILSYFEAHPEMTLIVRPHPLFFPTLRAQGLLDEEGEAALRRRLSSGNVMLDEEESYIPSFEASDALMADAGSFLLEYLPTGKPILYLENPIGPGLSETGSFVSMYYQARDMESVGAFLRMISERQDPRRNARMALLKEQFFRLDGDVGRSIKDHVVEAFMAEIASVECARRREIAPG